MNNKILMAKNKEKKRKKMSWQFLASIHKIRVAFVNGIQRNPRETRTCGYQRERKKSLLSNPEC